MTLRAERVCYAYGTAPVLADCSLTLRPGELVFLLGVNGAGKSTLLKLLAGVLDVQQGAVYCGDEALHRMPPRQRARCAAYLPQFTPAVDMTVEEYVLLGAVPYLSFGAVPEGVGAHGLQRCFRRWSFRRWPDAVWGKSAAASASVQPWRRYC